MPKGHAGEPKTPGSGRQKGTPNKSTQELLDRAKKLGVDPFDVLLLFAKGDWKKLGYEAEQAPSSYSEHGTVYKYTIDPSVRAKAAGEACSYLYAKRKAVEHTGDMGALAALSLAQLFASEGEDDAGDSAQPGADKK